MTTMASLALLTMTIGCSDEITEEEADDIAYATSVLLTIERSSDLEAYADAIAVVRGDSDLSDGASASAEGIRGSTSYAITPTCFDAGGDEQACDETAASADVTSVVQGDVESTRYDFTLDRTAEWRFDDLDATPQMTGQAAIVLDSSFQALYRDVERRYELQLDGDYDFTGSPDDLDAVAGTVRWDVTASRLRAVGSAEVQATRDTVVEATLNGDSTSTLTVAGNYTYRLDEDTGDLERE